MFNSPAPTEDRDEILRAIRHVRNRWRLRVAVRGIAVLVAAALGTLLVSSYGLELLRFTPNAIIGFRVLTYLALFVAGWLFFVRPILRRVSDERVALYLEEHEPSLQAEVLSAVEQTKLGPRDRAADHSPELVHQLIESAAAKIRNVDMGRAVEQQKLQTSSGLLIAIGVAAVLLFVFGPAYLRHGISALLMPTGGVQAASPYQIEVLPGDATVARGADQSITARLIGFESEDVSLLMRSSTGSGSYDRLPLIPIENDEGDLEVGMYEVLLFDLQETTDYRVESLGVESSTFTLDVIELPYVERLELEYHFPPYTGLEPRLVENGGDIAVLKGTEVRVRAVPTMGTTGGQLVFDDDDDKGIDLAVSEDGTLTAHFSVQEKGFYRVDLAAPDGELISASPQYTIDVLTDQPPSAMFIRPGRDTTASAIEEFFVEARADDDFGLHELDLVYSVNGGPEQTVNLFSGGTDTKEVSAGHTFFLEEMDLEPGDFVSYFARATDRYLSQQNTDVKSDLYFVQIRRYSQNFRAQQSQGGGGGMGGGGNPSQLSQAQREIISATFNLIRDRGSYAADDYQENLVFLTLAQGRLREQVETLLRRMNSRVMPADPVFRSIQDLLPEAAGAMRLAETELQNQDADAALPHEQRSLQFLQRAEEAYDEVMVTQGGGGGGGGGGGQQAAQDLADLFELELDKMRNQYETMQRGQQQQADNTVDELMERLRELARRQEREAERQRRRARGQQSTQGGGAGQRALAEEAEEAARRLERLAREQNSPQMMDASRRLQEAADAMRRAAANDDNLGFSEAGAALDRLREVQERLEGEQRGRLERDIDDQMRRANRLADEQREMVSEVRALTGLSDEERMTEMRRLMEQKDQMEAEVADLERQIDSTSAEFRRDERDASRELQEAAAGIRDNKLKEKIRYSKGLMRSRPGETANAFESAIGGDIDELAEQLEQAADAVGKSEGDRVAQALDKTRDLMRSLESLDHRMWQEGQEQAEGQQGQEGQEGQQGQSGPGGQRASRADGQPGNGAVTGGGPLGGYGYGDRRPESTAWEPGDIRQWGREYQERAGEAQELRRLLTEEGFDVGDLDAIIQRMRELDDLQRYRDPEVIAGLQTFVLEELKRFEYRLRREIDEENDDLFLAGNEEMPDQFRDLVEEYFRALSESQ